ncbi:MAG: helix-turn-helix domain-containing protein [Microbacteriaceae bacterium]
MLIREQLGGVLRDIRSGLGMTLGDVRDGARVSPAHLSELERGKTEPSSEIIRTLAEFYQISQAALFAEVATRMAASDSIHGVTAKRSVETIIFGDDYVIAGVAGDMSTDATDAMPDIRNVMPVVPDHIPDNFIDDAAMTDVDSFSPVDGAAE